MSLKWFSDRRLQLSQSILGIKPSHGVGDRATDG